MLRKVKHSIKQAVYRVIPPPSRQYSHAQAGEDVVLDFLLREVGLTLPRYLELGVFDPIQGSNTYSFYERGARGVLVEADESLLPTIRFARPGDRLVHCGVGTGEAKEADFFIFNGRGANTFSKEEAVARERSNSLRLEKTVKVPLLTINEIIERFCETCPDFLSIDIEGMDLPVLRSLDFKRFPIPIICAETCQYSETHIKPKNPAIAEFLRTVGYSVYADTYINTLFVKDTWFYKDAVHA